MTDSAFPSKNRILVIDDNPAIHADFRKILKGPDELSAGLDRAGAELFGETPRRVQPAGFEVDSAHSGEEGLVLVRKAQTAGSPYALAFVDVRMTRGWNGIETAARIFQSDADMQIVICTAYSDYSWEQIIEKLGHSDRLVILKKPFDTVEVLQLAHALTEKWRLALEARARMDQLEKMVAGRTQELHAANEQLKVEMAERAHAEESLRQSQKMEAVGQLAGGIAHDFNNLLTVIRGYVQYLKMEIPPKDGVKEALHEIDVAAERAATLTSQMLMFSRKKLLQPRSLDLNELVTQLGSMLRRLLGENIAMEIQTVGVPLFTHADPVMIEMVILNLALNARDAMPQGGRLLMQTAGMEIKAEDCRRNPKARPGMFASISVVDNGSGIAPEILPRIFEPFFTTKEVGKGTGLGLATVYGVVNQHGGWTEVESTVGQGATFTVFLPMLAMQPGLASSSTMKAVVVGGTETILLVEDESALRSLTRMVLQRQGYCVLEAASGAEALAVWDQQRTKIDLILTDMMMPGKVSGRELVEKILAETPDLKVVYTTGYSVDTVCPDISLSDGFNFLQKPYHPDKLIQTVRCRLDQAFPAPGQSGPAEN